MKQTIFPFLLLIFFLLSLSSLVIAQSEPNTFITFINSVDKRTVDNVFVHIETKEQEATYFLSKGENLKLFITPQEVSFEINDPLTQGYDYYAKTIFQNQTVFIVHVQPVGSLHGTVVDKLGNVIANVPLKFECNEIGLTKYPQNTDDFGSFSLPIAPIGMCTITATHEGTVGTKIATLTQGQKQQIIITLDKILVQEGVNYTLIVFSIASLLIIMVVILFFFIKKTKKVTSLQPGRESILNTKKDQINPKENLAIILPTLRDNERKIVEFLLQEKEPSHLSKIHLKTGISKGALFRNIASLEQKKIIETVMEGRVKKIKLSHTYDPE